VQATKLLCPQQKEEKKKVYLTTKRFKYQLLAILAIEWDTNHKISTAKTIETVPSRAKWYKEWLSDQF
jgi:hypothetical protein